MEGQFIKENRTDFGGIIDNNCRGVVDFPDGKAKSFKYYEEEYKIVWGDHSTGQVWNKGKNCCSLIIIQTKSVPLKNYKL